jgi:hypothetical protein
MKRRHLPVLLVLLAAAWLAVSGCGDKIAIPEPTGLFSVAPYLHLDDFDDDDPRQIVTIQGILFVLSADSLTKRDQGYERIAAVGGFGDPTALCRGAGDSLVFVWDQEARRVSWYHFRYLAPPEGRPASTDLPQVQRCVSMTTSPAGVEQVSGAETYLYLSDPDSGVVHRYAFDPFVGLTPRGILCRSDGDGTRFVHVPAGLARDDQDYLLVCDQDSLRNWVIRFDAVPDLEDTDPDGPDPLRGTAALFDVATGNPAPAADYVLGDAPEAGEDDWVGGPSAEEGAFDQPGAVTVDGSGRIYVSDVGNDRVQIFSPQGSLSQVYGSAELTPAPGSLAVVDVQRSADPEDVSFGAYLFVVAGGQVRKYISGERYQEENGEPPPPEY